MGNPITNKEGQLAFLNYRLSMFADLLNAIEPETIDTDDIDRLIKILDEIEAKMVTFKHRAL